MPENKARSDSKTLELAALDFARAPIGEIKDRLEISQSAIQQRRQTDLYKATVAELAEAYKERLLKTPGTNELFKEVHYGVSLAVKELIAIIASRKSANRDKISAGRVIVAMDPRFARSPDGDPKDPTDTEAVAKELVEAFNRSKGTLQ